MYIIITCLITIASVVFYFYMMPRQISNMKQSNPNITDSNQNQNNYNSFNGFSNNQGNFTNRGNFNSQGNFNNQEQQDSIQFGNPWSENKQSENKFNQDVVVGMGLDDLDGFNSEPDDIQGNTF